MGLARCRWEGLPRIALCLLVPALGAALAPPARADHPREVRRALDGLRDGNLRRAEQAFLKTAGRPGADQLLAQYELGSLRQMAGQFQASLELFRSADAVARGYEGRAVLSAGATGRGAGALLINDRVQRYEGSGCDKVLARTLNSLNYLMLGDLESARVELRKAEEYQRLERERSRREVAGPARVRPDDPAVAAAYGRMFDSVRNLRNSVENAFTCYLTGQVFLMRGEEGLNDAMVAIQRAYELAPQAPAVRTAYLEIARRQGGPAWDLAQARLGRDGAPAGPGGAPAVPVGGALVVCYQSGLAPVPEQVKLTLPVGERLYSLAFPIYNGPGPAQPPLELRAAAGRGAADVWRTAPVLDTRALAAKALQERLPGILTRGLLGAIAKGAVQKESEDRYGPVAGFLTGVAGYVLTSADRLAWLSLPAEIQVAQGELAPGRQTVQLRGPDWTGAVDLDIAPGSRTFLLVRAFPGYRRIDARTFLAAVSPPARPELPTATPELPPAGAPGLVPVAPGLAPVAPGLVPVAPGPPPVAPPPAASGPPAVPPGPTGTDPAARTPAILQ